MSDIGRRWPANVLAAFLSAALLYGASAAPERAPRRHVVEIRGFEYVPQTLEVAVGDTVVWVNRDFVPHTATATDSTWDSGDIARDGSWSYVPRERGRQEYLCALHPTMKGSFTVK